MDTSTSIMSQTLAPKNHTGGEAKDAPTSTRSPKSTPQETLPDAMDASSPDAAPADKAAPATATATLTARVERDDNAHRMATPESNATNEPDTAMEDAQADDEPGERSEESELLDELLMGVIDGENLDDLLEKQEAQASTSGPSPETEPVDEPKSASNIGTGRKKPRAVRTVSIKYTPAEKYWLNRTYRAYRVQQAAQKQAKAKKETYTPPPEGLMTHASMMDAFNARFHGKYVDGVTHPRPARERHAFGLWSAKNMSADDQDMKASLPDYWVREKKAKPVGISLAEATADEWDTDEYLGVTVDAPFEGESPQKSRKRKASSAEGDGGEKKKKKARVGGKVVVVDRIAEFNRVFARAWPASRPRRYSAPDLRLGLEASHLRPVRGEFDYSWRLEQAKMKGEH